MSSNPYLTVALTRRSWVVLAASALSGCGGGDGPSVAFPGTGGTGNVALPGTGGTGIYVRGSILGFGSVWVNGIKFDDTSATVQLDGQSGRSSDLRLGMVAGIQGQRGVDVTLGVASSIDTWSIAQGPVTSPLAGQFSLAGMTLQIDGGTVFDGMVGASALDPGLTVRVWGLQASADGSHWIATRVAVVNATTVVSTGIVTSSGSRRYVNGLQITGQTAPKLNAGQLARVQGTLSSSGDSLEVESVKLLGAESDLVQQGETEIEGLVTAVVSATRFTLGTVDVDASQATFSPASTSIAPGLRLEVKGIWQGRLLKAARVEVEDEEDGATKKAIEIEAPIEVYTSLSSFVVRGQLCDATLASMSPGAAAELRVGVRVHLTGTLSGNVLMVSELEVEK